MMYYQHSVIQTSAPTTVAGITNMFVCIASEHHSTAVYTSHTDPGIQATHHMLNKW